MLQRHPGNPILTRRDLPAIGPELVAVSSVFNPGAVRFGEKFLLMLRIQNRGCETFLMMAEGPDGYQFRVKPQVVHFQGIEKVKDPILHCYDPRITALEGTFYIMVALDMEEGCRLGLARTDDFETFDFLGVVCDEDNRNGVLFPEKIGGRYLRLDRPNKTPLWRGTTTGETICLSESDDLLHWRFVAPVVSGRFHYWDELIGAGPPPIKTQEGWLQIYHGVALHLSSIHIYQAGVLLLDLNDPSKVLARSRYNILEPRELYEVTGQVPNVVFPSGAVPDETDGEGFAPANTRVHLYYGAADTCIGVAHATVKELIRAARNE